MFGTVRRGTSADGRHRPPFKVMRGVFNPKTHVRERRMSEAPGGAPKPHPS